MTKLGTVMIAVALVAGGTSLAMAQNGPPTGGQSPVAGGANGNNGMPPATYKGPGAMKTYKSSEFQGSPALYDRASPAEVSGSAGTPPSTYKGPGAMKTYKSAEFQGGRKLEDQAPAAANGNNGMPPESYKGPGAMKTYKSSQ